MLCQDLEEVAVMELTKTPVIEPLQLENLPTCSDWENGLVPLERPFREERSMTRTSSTKSLRTPSTKTPKIEVKVDALIEEEMGSRTMSDMSCSTQSSASTIANEKKSFIRRSFHVLARRQTSRRDDPPEFTTTFHTSYSIVKAVSVVKEILRGKGHRFSQEKREESLRCLVPVRNQFKPLSVHVSFVFDIGRTEICVYSNRPSRDEFTKTAFVNFYKVILVELRATGPDAVLP